MQALYQWEMTHATITDVISEFMTERAELKKADVDYFNDLLHGTANNFIELQQEIAASLDRNLDQLDPVERAVLMVGTYELMFHQEIPWRVIVNEAVDLAKMFGAEKSYKYINGVLDKIAHRIRPVEIMNIT